MVQLLRKDLEKHTKEECPRRQYKCPHCQEEGEYREMTTKHLSKCSMLEVSCPKRRCRTSILRRDLSKHRKECLFEKVPCKYSIIGCDEVVERKDLEEHEEDTEQHLQLALDTVHEQQNKIRDIQQTAEQQQMTIRDMQAKSRKMPITFKFTDLTSTRLIMTDFTVLHSTPAQKDTKCTSVWMPMELEMAKVLMYQYLLAS